MKKIFSMVFLALVVSGAVILGDVREAKADWGSPYAMNANLSLYFYYEGQPYGGFRVELIDPRQSDADNLVQVGYTDAFGCVTFRNARFDWQIRFVTPMGNEVVQQVDTSMGIIELAGWR